MHLILVRHAEKNLVGGPDPGLNPRGLRQAQDLAEQLIGSPRWPRPDRIACSPRRRAQETVAPLADALALPAQVLPELDEKKSQESGGDFRQRLRRLLTALEDDGARCVVWCTHLDWIEEFRALIDCEDDLMGRRFDHWSPGQYLILRLDDLWSVVDYARSNG